MMRLELATPGLQTQCSSHWATRAQKLLLGRSWVYPVGVLHHYILSFLNWDWLLIREVHWFYWTQKLLVPVEKFTVRMPMVRLELATPGLQTQCSSHWATRAQKLLLGRSWVYPVGVLHHYILSFLNWDWLLIREVHWLYWTQKLLVPVEKFTVRMPMVRLELATPGLQTQCSSHWATRAQKLLLGRSWIYPVGVLHHYILSFLNWDWLLIREVQWFYWTQKLLVPEELELATPGLQTQCSSHWATRAQKLLLGRSWVYPVGVLHHYICTSRMRSQSQLRNDNI